MSRQPDRTAWTQAVEAFEAKAAEVAAADLAGTHNADELADELADLHRALEQTPAPDVSAVLYKMRQDIGLMHGVHGATIEDAIRALRAGDSQQKCQAAVYDDLCRLAGETVVDDLEGGLAARWDAFIADIATSHPRAAEAGRQARAKGMNLDHFAGVSVLDRNGESLPCLTFTSFAPGEPSYLVGPETFGKYVSLEND